MPNESVTFDLPLRNTGSAACVALAERLNTYVSAIPLNGGELGELVMTPYDFPDGETVTLHVHQTDDDSYLISDLGLAASRLGETGIDITRGSAHELWEAITEDLVDGYEISTSTNREHLGETMMRIAQIVIRTDVLRLTDIPKIH